MDGLMWIRQRLVATIAERRTSPRDDMISYLVQATVFDRPVSDEEVFDMAMLVIQGGFDTTGSSISSALRYLDEHPDTRQRLIDDPSLIPTAVEEFLRYEAPQFALARTATRDVEVAGRQVRAGERLLLVWASGNRDDAMFENPDDVVLDRFPNRHMTFGLGAHRCLGSTLARRQIVLALGAVLRRLPDYRIDRERTVRAETIGVTYGTFSMPCRFTPGPRYF
jgi:cytochrome P450